MKLSRYLRGALALASTAALALLLALAPAVAQVPSLQNFRNLLVGGDVGADAFQGGTTAVTGINTTGTYYADDFYAFANNAGASVTLTRENAAPDISIGYRASVRIQRASSNTNTAAIVYGQILESALAIQLQGQTVVMSAVCQAGANFSGAGVVFQLVSGTSADEGLATRISGFTGANTQTSATFVLPASGFARVGQGSQTVTISGTGAPTTGYAVASFVVPTGSQELAAEITYTPVGTAGTNDWVECEHIQLEAVPTPPSGTPVQATAPERRPLGVELALAQRYFYAFTDGAATRHFPCFGESTATTTAIYTCNMPVTMRVAPTIAVSVAASFAATTTAGAAANCTTLAATATANTTTAASLTCTTGATQTAGTAVPLLGQATASVVSFSARL